MDVLDFRDLNSFSYITSFCRQQENSNQINSANAYLSTINNSIMDNRVTDNRITDNRITDNRVTDNRITDNRVTDNRVTYNMLTRKEEHKQIES